MGDSSLPASVEVCLEVAALEVLALAALEHSNQLRALEVLVLAALEAGASVEVALEEPLESEPVV